MLDGLIADDDEAAIAAITLAELLAGVHLADPVHGPLRQAFIDDIVDVIPVVDYDDSVAAFHAEFLAHVRRQGQSHATHDLIIAATAKATHREVVSADSSAYRELPGVAVRPHRV